MPWWKGAAIYQIYPRSFMDSNGDGIGDLPGITAKLDHVASLGVDGIWISPFFASPMKDFGYDVSDYRDVDPIFGTLDDFDALVARAHELGLKVLIDQVYSHTSDEHAWFEESRASRDNPRADWYVWADPKADGSPPSNWQSVFGGPAWTWDARRGQYYLHNFLASQPQLNLHNVDVQDAVLDVMRFWLDRGVDGYRIDALNFAMHDPELKDNPPAPDNGKQRTRPFDFQLRIHNQSHPDIPDFIARIRKLTDQYDAIFTVAEVGGDDADREMKLFTLGESHLNSAYGFDFLYADALTPGLVCDALGMWPDKEGMGWPSWAFENHDAPRALSRWCAPEDRPAYARMKALLLAVLRGNIIIYQGEELGLTQVDIPFDQLHDPEAIANWPLTLSRDGARTPMPWKDGCGCAGFGSDTPWLPVGEDNFGRSVERQENDPASLLNHTRAMLKMRNAHPALRYGAISRCEIRGDMLVLERVADGEMVTAFINTGGEQLSLQPGEAAGKVLATVNDATASRLPPFAALVVQP
ncbi:Maltodextrin glucosidase [Aurantiacibacter gangjinensis]|nr:Maltodextrin glucosidase [Aurantiacibacter gangjinensis]